MKNIYKLISMFDIPVSYKSFILFKETADGKRGKFQNSFTKYY
jgi:hypothetical protein